MSQNSIKSKSADPWLPALGPEEYIYVRRPNRSNPSRYLIIAVVLSFLSSHRPSELLPRTTSALLEHDHPTMLLATILTLAPLLVAGAPHNLAPRQAGVPGGFCGLASAEDGTSFDLTFDPNNACIPFAKPVGIFTLDDFGTSTGNCGQCIFYE